MKLYLVRHGEYKVSDLKAPLNAKGKNDIHKLCQFLKNAQIEVSTILHSDKLRAQQTAEILATKILKANDNLQYHPGLAPMDDVTKFIQDLALYSKDSVSNIMIVSHLPFLSRLASQLLIDDANKEIIIFEPGTLLCLENTFQTEWHIKWMISPDLLT